MNLPMLGVQAKVILLLSGLLLASSAANVLQLRSAWVGYGERKAAAHVADLTAKVDGYKITEAVNTAISERKAMDTTVLLSQLNAIAARGQETRIVYAKAARAKPLAAICTPGADRISAVNTGLGPIRSPK